METKYQDLVCALSDDQHFSRTPIVLPGCGHSICKECLPKEENQLLKCKLCGVLTERDLRNDAESRAAKQFLMISLKDLMNIIAEKMENQLKKLKTLQMNDIENIELNLKYIEEEIEIKIESIKCDLDALHEKFKKDIRLIKTDLLNPANFNFDKNKDFYEKRLRELHNDTNNSVNQTEDKLFSYQDALINLNNLVKNFDKHTYDLELKLSNENVKETCIGEIIYRNPKTHVNRMNDLYKTNIFQLNPTEVKRIIENNDYDVINLNSSIYDASILPNNLLLLPAYRKLIILDDKFNIMNEIDSIESKVFDPEGVAIDKNNIYICDYKNCCILKLDSGFNQIKSFDFEVIKPIKDEKKEQLRGICFENGFIYICDLTNNRIHILSEELEYLSYFETPSTPKSIKSSANILCVATYSGTYFYHVEKTKLQYLTVHVRNAYCKISLINSYFYETNFKTKKLKCFNLNGYLEEEVDLNKFSEYITNYNDGVITYFNNNLIITSYSKKKLLK